MKKKQFWHTQMFVVNVHIYRVDVVVCVNMSGKDAYRRFRRWKLKAGSLEKAKECCDDWEKDHREGTHDGRMFNLNGGFLVFLKLGKNRFRQGVGILVHEMTHVTHYLLRNRNIPLTEDTEEAHTYLVQYLTTEALRELY